MIWLYLPKYRKASDLQMPGTEVPKMKHNLYQEVGIQYIDTFY